MIDQVVAIAENRKINEKYFKLVFRSRNLSRKVKPGQFLNILIENSFDPFLRRPFSYYRVTGDRIEILYEILGKGTAILARKQKGDNLQVMGPLGKPFTSRPGKKRVLIGGGIGVPPLLFLAETYGTDYFLIGSKSKLEVLPRKEFGKLQPKVRYSTNDGSFGVHGYVTRLLEDLLKKEKPEKLFIHTCGPTVMMRAVLKIARNKGIDGEVSCEETMACGVGACLGCMVKTPDGWAPSCTEGPVFNFDQLDWKS